MSIGINLCNETCKGLYTLEKVDKVNVSKSDEEQLCTVYDENHCRFDFVYNDRDEKHVVIKTDHVLVCSPTVLTFNVIVSIVGSIVLIGLATLLLWKCITYMQYRREFASFEEERKNACWNTVSNVTFNKVFTLTLLL